MNDISLMTYSVRHGKGLDGHTKLHRIAEEIAKSNADVVALQGIDRYIPRSGFQDQLKKLSKQLGMYSCFSPSVNLLVSQYGNAILSNYPIIKKEITFMKGTKERRSILMAKIQMDKAVVTVMNTHLGKSTNERTKQVPILLNTLNQYGQPSILAGDFNMEKHDTLMKPFNFHWQKIELQEKCPTFKNGKEIDHIFVNMPTEFSSAWVQHSTSSDHHPVIARIQWS
ncbi:endonuclease/exonuclease/phosphatase family protein [Paenibacillus lautus]|uniref:endonuclease/exonuclease/phosphatase family protein n=1 Tax=Paenibacillus lautus TaxID=1401 RepID=UPI001C106FC1|nr:endonuclease/exonuclease/phosphatase family protein [Paenibacillus lautus]MBU5348351.1 endonuclease/exonuclease/phosphatase family protein [Paenibacillus lautus]